MRALVTGAAGFIGRELVRQLVAAGWSVVAVDDLSGPGKWPELAGDVECITADSAAFLFNPGPYDAVFSLASPVGPVGVLAQAGQIIPAIVAEARNAWRHASVWGCPLVYVSTSELYGVQPGPASEASYSVFAPEHTARQEYALGKRAAEATLLGLGGRVRIVRPFNIAGPHQRAGGGFVIPRWIEQAKRDEPLTVYGTGRQRRAFCHVTDFVRGLIAVLLSGRDGETYNLGNPANECTIGQLAAMFAREWPADRPLIAQLVDPKTLHGPAFAEAPDKLPVIDKAREWLGWDPVYSNREIIRDAIEAAR